MKQYITRKTVSDKTFKLGKIRFSQTRPKSEPSKMNCSKYFQVFSKTDDDDDDHDDSNSGE